MSASGAIRLLATRDNIGCMIFVGLVAYCYVFRIFVDCSFRTCLDIVIVVIDKDE